MPRDSAANIYRTCKQAGTCPPDVVNKIENTTVADKILQYGSAGVYLGGLGISTGRGSGGATGYVPIGETPGVTVGARPVPRPSIPVDTLGPRDLFPVDTIRPTDPSIIDLSSAPTPTDTSINIPEVEVVAEIHPVPTNGPSGTPTTITDGSSAGDVAVIEVSPEAPPPTRARLRASTSTHHNPAFHGYMSTNAPVGEATGMESISVVGGSGGRIFGGSTLSTSGGGESIELMPFTSSDTLDLSVVEETTFGGRTSTPLGARTRPAPSRRYFQYTETPLRDIWSPRRAVGADFINPAFQDETLVFPELEGQAPNRDFTGITEVGRVFWREAAGRLRIGRLGQKTSLRTRSGVTVGPRHYFFHDISSIEPISTDIELSTLSSDPLEGVNVHNDAGAIVDDSLSSVDLDSWSDVSDRLLLEDDDSYEFHGQLVLGTRRETKQVNIPFIRRPISEVAVTVNYGNQDDVDMIPSPDVIQPSVYEGLLSGVDYYLHPSLRRKRRRRRPYVILHI